MTYPAPTKAEQTQALAFAVVSLLGVGAVFSILNRLNEQQRKRLRDSGREMEL